LKPIPDHLSHTLNVLFVGFSPSIRSGETGHHYANPHNRFWAILYRAGLTPHKFRPEEDQKLLDLGYGLTNIVSRPTRGAADINKEEYRRGKKVLMEKIKYYNPKVVCFVGKGVYQQYSGQRQTAWGIQTQPVVPETIDFVAPSSSGLVRIKLDEVVEIYRQLPDLIDTP